MAVTIVDIARAVNMTHGTVSRALRDSQQVNNETRKLIKLTARKMGYRPNLVARSFRTRRTFTLGMICGEVHTPYFAEATQAIHKEAEARGYSLYLAVTEWDRKKQTEELQKLFQRRVDGVLLWSSDLLKPGEVEYETLVEARLPVVMLNHAVKGFSSVVSDWRPGMDQAVRYLKSKGLGRVGFLGQSNVDKSTYENRLAFLLACRENAVEPVEYECLTTLEDAHRAGRDIGRDADRPGALIVLSDYIATGAIHGLDDVGVNVPRDMAIVGSDGTEMGAYFRPPLTTIFQDREKLATTAMDVLLERLNRDDAPCRTVALPTRLIVRASA
jgi:DNA-binding LacI/PurR family transcriptional regulator